MLNTLQRMWKPLSHRSSGQKKAHDASLAVTVLMLKVMQQDDRLEASELNEIKRAIRLRFDLSEAATSKLIADATEAGKQANDFHQFTAPLVDAYSQQERADIVRQLWCVAMADGNVDPYEEALIRKVAELTGVDHDQFIVAKIAARKT